MQRSATILFLGLLTSFLIWGGVRAEEESPRAVTKEAVLHWAVEHKDAQPAFQPGEVLKLADMERLRPFLPPGYFDEFRFAEVAFTIAPSGDYGPHPAYREATERFSGQTRMTADGALENYVAGQPFPNSGLDPHDPTSGLKVAWNYNFRWQHYGQKAIKVRVLYMRRGNGNHQVEMSALPGGLINGGGNVDRILELMFHRVYFNHLATLPGQHYTLDTPDAKDWEWKDYMEFFEPYDLRGMRYVVQRAADPHQPDQAISYLPNQRKVRRLSAEERADAFLGTELILDDFFGFSGRVLDYTWTFHGWKDVLHVMNSQHPVPSFYGPHSRVPSDRWEVRKCIVVEQVPKHEGHPYGSKLIFLDAQTYRITSALVFDKEGKLWKVIYTSTSWSEEATDHPELNHGVSVPRVVAIGAIDFKTGNSTLVPIFETGYPRMARADVELLFDGNKLTEGRR